jgi:hypothetical protein
MEVDTLAKRIERATGIEVEDKNDLFGFFSQFRPDGVGLEAISADSGVEGEVLARIRRVFAATAPGWAPGQLYFKIRRFEALDAASAQRIAGSYLMAFQRFVQYVGNAELSDELAGVRVESHPPVEAQEDTHLPIAISECLGDFLAQQQPSRHELFLLKEALYSMAADYFLAAYMLRPVLPLEGDAGQALDEYFDIWRYGIKLKFYKGGIAAISLPKTEDKPSQPA